LNYEPSFVGVVKRALIGVWRLFEGGDCNSEHCERGLTIRGRLLFEGGV
jgi:hypothetical protein